MSAMSVGNREQIVDSLLLAESALQQAHGPEHNEQHSVRDLQSELDLLVQLRAHWYPTRKAIYNRWYGAQQVRTEALAVSRLYHKITLPGGQQGIPALFARLVPGFERHESHCSFLPAWFRRLAKYLRH